jgi:tetratricopeptide (TPR) repeat protein/transcriptional regulator with XRE-family HTH domain
MALPEGFSGILHRLRLAANLTQDELAERAGISARSIGDIERGVSRAPRRDTVLLLADALGLTEADRATFEAAARRLDRRSLSPSHPARAVSAVGVWRPDESARTPFVGRAHDLALIDRQLSNGGPALLMMAGEPGMGKSRLLGEAASRAVAREWTVLESGCQRPSGLEPYAPVVGAVKTYLSGRSGDALRNAMKECGWLVRLLPELTGTIAEESMTWTLAPDQERRLMFDAVIRFLHNVAGPRGTLLVLDDLQWAGRDAVDLLAAIVRSAAVPIRVIGAYRDTETVPNDLLAVMLADLAIAGLVTHHTLAPLTGEESTELLDTLLNRDSADGGARGDAVLRRAGGVPFFLVSCAQWLRGGALDDSAAVPWDVSHSVRQRMAALPSDVQALLGTAAVIGRVVHPTLVAAVTGQSEEAVSVALEVAVRARLIVDLGNSYQFAHDLIREVAESDIGSARRLLLHRRIAAAIERLDANALHGRYETLAYHYLHGEAWEPALTYLVLSGDKARAAHAMGQALHFYAQALSVCGTLGASGAAAAITLAEKRGNVCFDSGDFPGAATDFDKMRAAAHALGDRHREAMALAYRGMALLYAHEFEDAEETLRAALTLAGTEFPDARLLAGTQLASLLSLINRHDEFAILLAEAEALAPSVDDPLSQAWLSMIGNERRTWTGRYDDAVIFLDGWRGAVERTHQITMLLWNRWEEALARGGRGDYDRAIALLDEVLATSERIGEVVIAARAMNTLGWIYGELQDHERAMALNERSLTVASAADIADMEIQNNARVNLGDNLMALGRAGEAEKYFRRVEGIVRNPRPQDRWLLWRIAQHLFHSMGEACLTRGDLPQALAYADECLALAEPSESRKNIVKARRLRADALLRMGALPQAHAELVIALSLAREIGNPPQIWKTHVTIAQLRRAQGRPDDATAAYREALAVIDSVAAGLADTALRRTFLTSPHVQSVRESIEQTSEIPSDSIH